MGRSAALEHVRKLSRIHARASKFDASQGCCRSSHSTAGRSRRAQDRTSDCQRQTTGRNGQRICRWHGSAGHGDVHRMGRYEPRKSACARMGQLAIRRQHIDDDAGARENGRRILRQRRTGRSALHVRGRPHERQTGPQYPTELDSQAVALRHQQAAWRMRRARDRLPPRHLWRTPWLCATHCS